MKMKILGVYLLIASLTYHANAKDFMLEGSLGEYLGEPVTVHCSQEKGYIRLGGITINNVPLNRGQQQRAKSLCENQMKKVENSRKTAGFDSSESGRGTECLLSFPNMHVNNTDTVRVVYRCYDSRPSGSPDWGKGKNSKKPTYKTVSRKNRGEIKIQCNKHDEMMFITKTEIDEKEVNLVDHPDLDPLKMSGDCFEQWTRALKGSSSITAKPTCYLANRPKYGGELFITYACYDAGKDRKKVKNNGSKKE